MTVCVVLTFAFLWQALFVFAPAGAQAFGRSEKRFFQASERPQFTVAARTGLFRHTTTPNVRLVTLTDSRGNKQPVPFHTAPSQDARRVTVTVDPPDDFQPGRYEATIIAQQNEQLQTITQDFHWGVLALNMPSAVVRPWQDVPLHIAVLDDAGAMVCDADVRMTVTDPAGTRTNFRSSLGERGVRRVWTSSTCNKKERTERPDYEAHFRPTEPGTYRIRLTVETERGRRELEDALTVTNDSPLYVQRRGFPTRVYPAAPYPVSFVVRPARDFQGTFTENVPAGFVLADITDRGTTSTVGDRTVIQWQVNWQAGGTYHLGYTLDAPDQSPAFYQLGPFQADNIREVRPWQMAIDGTEQFIAFTDGDVPSGWTCISCLSGDDFYQKFIRANTTYGGTGGTTTHTHTMGLVSTTNSGTSTTSTNGGALPVYADVGDEHPTISGTSIGTGTNVPVYQTLKMIQYNTTGNPSTLPAGVIAFFETAPTGNWTRYTAQDDDFIVGEANATTTGGSATHTHTFSGTLDSDPAAAGVTTLTGSNSSPAGATISHSHTFSGTTAANDHTPSHIDFLLYQTTATVSTPSGIIGMWSNTPPAGWTTNSGAAGRFLRGAATYSVPSATPTHTPSNTAVTSGVSANNTNRRVTTPATTISAGTHTHSTTVSFGSATNQPPFRDVILGKKDAAASVTISGTIYTDEGTTAYNCSSNNLTVAIRVNGAGTYSGTCSASDGTYSIGSVSISAGDIVTVFLDGETEKAVTVTRSSNAAISGLDLYQSRLIVRDEDGSPMENSLLGLFDADDDADLSFTSNSNTLSLQSGMGLHVWTGKTFTPGGSITTTASSTPSTAAGDVRIASSATLTMGTNALSIGGDYNNAGTFSKSTGHTTTFTATATGFSVTPGTGNFDSLTFNGSGGGWSPTAALAVDVDLTMTAGTLSGTQNVTVNGAVAGTAGSLALTGGTFTQRVASAKNFGTTSGSTAWSFNNLTFSNSAGSSSTVTTQSGGTGSIAVAGTLTVGNGSDSAGTTFDLSNRTWIFTGTSPISVTSSPAATLTINTSTIRFASTSAMTVPLSLSYSTLELRPNSSGSPDYTLGTAVSQTLSVSGSLTIGDGTNAVTIRSDTYNPAINVAGSVTIGAGAAFTKGTGTFTFNGTTAATYTDSTTTKQNLGVVSINKTDTTAPSTNNKVTLASSMTVDTLSIDGTAGQADTLDLGSGSYTLQVANGGATADVLTISGTLTIGTSTVQFSATNASGNININNLAYSSLRVSGAETYVLTGNQNGNTKISGSLTIDTGATLDVTANDYALELGGSWSNSGNFVSRSGTVTLSGSATQNIISGDSAFSGLTIANTGAAGTSSDDSIPWGTLTVTGALAVTSGELKLSTNNPNVSVAGSMTIGASGIITKGTGTFTFNGTTAATYTDSTTTKQNLGVVSINKTDTTAPSTNNKVTLASSMTVDTLSIDGTAGQADTLSLGSSGYTLKLAKAGSSSAVLTVSGTLSAGTSTIEFAATNSSGSVTIPALTYSGLTVSGNETYEAAGDMTVSGNLTISAGTYVAPIGTLRLGGSLTNNGSFSANGGTVELTASSGTKTLTMASGSFAALSLTGSATYEAATSLTASGTMTISAGTLSQGSKSLTVGALTVSGGTFSGGTGSLDVNGALTISSGTMTAPSGDTTVSGNFTHSGGTFSHNTGTIVLDGGDQTISSTTTFYSLKKTVTTARTLTFPASATQTVVGTLTLKGASGALLSLRSSTSGTRWKIDPQGDRSLQYLDVKDSQNTNATKIATSGLHVTDSGNNKGWAFPPKGPTDFSGTAASSTKIVWSWQDISDDEEGFKLQDADGTTLITIASSNATGVVETGLVHGLQYTRQVVAYNEDGDSEPSETAQATTNVSPPTIPTIAGPADDALMKKLTPTFTFSRSTDEDDGMGTYALLLNAGQKNPKTVSLGEAKEDTTTTLPLATVKATATTIVATLTDNTLLAEGENTWKVRATDTAENSSDSAQRSFTIDVTKPALAAFRVTPLLDRSTAKSDFTTTSAQPKFQLSFTDNHQLRQMTLTAVRHRYLLGTEIGTTRELLVQHALSSTKDELTITPSAALPYGTYTLTVATEDAAGNVSTASRTLEISTPEKLTQQPPSATTPPSEEREKEIEEGKTPSKTPPELTLPSLEKFARIRRERESANFLDFLERFLPVSTLARFNNTIVAGLDLLTDRIAFATAAARDRIARALGFTGDQLAALSDLVHRSKGCGEACSVREREAASAPAIAALNRTLPRFAGRSMLALRTARDRVFGTLVAARKNRNRLASTNETQLARLVEPVVRTVRWAGVGFRVAIEGISGRYDTPMVISNVAIETVEPTRAVITWQTSRQTRGKVNYGPSISYGNEVLITELRQDHEAVLTGLTPNTKYYFEILANDLNGGQTFDAYYGFTTPAE